MIVANGLHRSRKRERVFSMDSLACASGYGRVLLSRESNGGRTT
jgi:hypothetical protein